MATAAWPAAPSTQFGASALGNGTTWRSTSAGAVRTASRLRLPLMSLGTADDLFLWSFIGITSIRLGAIAVALVEGSG